MVLNKFLLNDKVCVITGAAGLMGKKHAEAIIEAQGIPVLLDISKEALDAAKKELNTIFPDLSIDSYVCDITLEESVKDVAGSIVNKYGHIDVLINNAANNPKVEEKGENFENKRFDNFPVSIWNEDIAVGLTGAFICSKVFGKYMEERKKGVILNISSDLGIIAPDQRIYRKDGLEEKDQTIKPVTYSVVKHGLIGLTKYMATYWANSGIRVNAIAPGGIYNGQDDEFIEKLTNLIPMGRMANKDEYKATIIYMISDASAYMTGTTVSIDGGRTCW